MTHRTHEIESYWHSYLESLKPGDRAPESYQVWYFGDDERLANRLAELVRAGAKTATSALVWELEARGEPVPRVGDVSVVITWDGRPACIIETTGVEVRPFREVDPPFVNDYGEGDRSLR